MNEFARYYEETKSVDLHNKEVFANLFDQGLKLLKANNYVAALTFGTSAGTISRWRHGHSAPALAARKIVINSLANVMKHRRGLCGTPDIEGSKLPREEAETNPPNCKCCGNKLKIKECESIGMAQLGMFLLVCDYCRENDK